MLDPKDGLNMSIVSTFPWCPFKIMRDRLREYGFSEMMIFIRISCNTISSILALNKGECSYEIP